MEPGQTGATEGSGRRPPPRTLEPSVVTAEPSAQALRRKVRLGQAAARKHLEPYGVRFDAVDLVDLQPPDELADALNVVLTAQVEAEDLHRQTESVCLLRALAAEEDAAVARAETSPRSRARLLALHRRARERRRGHHQAPGALGRDPCRRPREVTLLGGALEPRAAVRDHLRCPGKRDFRGILHERTALGEAMSGPARLDG